VIKSSSVKWAGHVERLGKQRHAYCVLGVNRERKRLLRRSKC
jgi:hypothetical protein